MYNLGAMLINNLMYAVELVLLAPSPMDLSLLLSVCSEYGLEPDFMHIQHTTVSNVMLWFLL